MKNINFLSEDFLFLVVKFSIYMNRCVFVMSYYRHRDATDQTAADLDLHCLHIP